MVKRVAGKATSNAKKNAIYAGVKRGGADGMVSFACASDIESLKIKLNEMSEEELPKDEKEESSEKNSEEIAKLRHIMNRTIEAIYSQSSLLFLTSFFEEAYEPMLVDREIVQPLEAEHELAYHQDDIKIYRITGEEHRNISSKLERVKRVKRGMAALPSALLMSIVATFDSSIADVVRSFLSIKSDALKAGGRTIALADVLQAGSIDDIKEKVIDDEIYEFSRGSHEEQARYIEKSFHVSIIKHWKRWPDFIEVFERRNLIAHGETTFTKRYVAICSKHEHKGSEKLLGTPIKLSPTYLQQSIELLVEFGVLLVFTLWRKQFSNCEKEAFTCVSQAAYNLIEQKRYTVPIRVLEHVLALENTGASDEIRKMMTVNLASSFRHTGNKVRCDQILGRIDWSGSGDNFKICAAALREDIEEVKRLFPIVVAAESVGRMDFRRWPVFDFIRTNTEFALAFQKAFKEPLEGEKQSEVVALSGHSEVSDEGVVDGITKH